MSPSPRTSKSAPKEAAEKKLPEVTINLKTQISALQSMNGVYANVPSGLSWMAFFKNISKLNIESQKYSVKRNEKGPRHNLLEPVAELMYEFSRCRKQYTVQLVENTKRNPAPPVSTKNSKVAVASTSTGGATATAEPKKKGRKPNSTAAAVNGSVESDRTMPLLATPSATKRGVKRRAAEQEQQPPQAPPGRQRFAEDDFQLPGSPPRANKADFDFDDTASQSSQESQDDLVRAGVTLVDLKPDVLDRALNNVSNVQLLRIQEELRKLRSKGQWMRYSSRAPQASNFLMELFFPPA